MWIGASFAQVGPPASKHPPVAPPPARPGNIVPEAPPYRSRWTLTLPHSTQINVAAGPANLFVSTDTMPLRAFTVTQGRPAWESTLKPDHQLVAGDDLVFVIQGGAMHAVEQATGRTRWTATVGPLAVGPTWAPQWLFTPGKDGTITAWRTADGTEVWKRALGAPASAPLAVDGDRLFAGLTDRRLVCLEITADGRQLWATPLLGERGVALQTTAVAGRVYFGASDYAFYSVKQESGEFEWPPHRMIHATIVGRPVVDERHIWIATLNNRVDALSRGNGEIDLIQTLPSRPAEQLLIEGGQVIVPLESGDLAFFAQKDGSPVRRRPLAPPPGTPPATTPPGTPPPPPIEVRLAPNVPLFAAFPPLEPDTARGGVTAAVPALAALPSPAGTSLRAPLLLAGPSGAPHLLKVTLGPDAVHTITAYSRDATIDPKACVFAFAPCAALN